MQSAPESPIIIAGIRSLQRSKWTDFFKDLSLQISSSRTTALVSPRILLIATCDFYEAGADSPFEFRFPIIDFRLISLM